MQVPKRTLLGDGSVKLSIELRFDVFNGKGFYSILSQTTRIESAIDLKPLKLSDVVKKAFYAPISGANTIHEVIKHPNGTAYVPGSALKGAIRTTMALSDPNAFEQILNNVNLMRVLGYTFIVRDVDIGEPDVMEATRIYVTNCRTVRNVRRLQEVLSKSFSFDILFREVDVPVDKFVKTINNKLPPESLEALRDLKRMGNVIRVSPNPNKFKDAIIRGSQEINKRLKRRRSMGTRCKNIVRSGEANFALGFGSSCVTKVLRIKRAPGRFSCYKRNRVMDNFHRSGFPHSLWTVKIDDKYYPLGLGKIAVK